MGYYGLLTKNMTEDLTPSHLGTSVPSNPWPWGLQTLKYFPVSVVTAP